MAYSMLNSQCKRKQSLLHSYKFGRLKCVSVVRMMCREHNGKKILRAQPNTLNSHKEGHVKIGGAQK